MRQTYLWITFFLPATTAEDDEQNDEDEENPETNEIQDTTGHIPRERDDRVKRDVKNPPESQFKHLQPSDGRYTFIHDEF